MCGILFISSKKNFLNKKKCLSAFKSLRNRGPDKQLYEFLDKKNFLANSILSITGKVKNGSNLYSHKNLKLSYNGEIYNYQNLQKKYSFEKNKVESDTDVLVRLNSKLGLNSTPKVLDGMFAYCVVDIKKNIASFVTDPQGEKKLFIYNDENYFIVSSTILAIKKFVDFNKIDYEVLQDYFSTRHFLFNEKTIFKNLTISKPATIFNYNISNHKITSKYYFDILSLINEKKYKYYKKLKHFQLENKFEQLFKNQLKLMVPKRRFASVFSGGIDSSIVSKLISKFKQPHLYACLDHINKDNTMFKVEDLSKRLNGIFIKKKISPKDYFNCLEKVYKLYLHPFSTHDFIGRYLIANFFMKNNCKVYFVADGADELFGGYTKYKQIKWKEYKNCSPYSIYRKDRTKNKSSLKKHLIKLWKSAFQKYKKFCGNKEASIQASLFVDYFSQCVSVGNIGTDIMSGDNSIEARTVFIQKSIIEFAINLPLKNKIDFESKQKKFVNKPLLKKLFVKFFGENSILNKQGFPGFPNETFEFLKKDEKKKVKKIFNSLSNKKFDRDLLWKILNIFYFSKFNKIKINYKLIK